MKLFSLKLIFIYLLINIFSNTYAREMMQANYLFQVSHLNTMNFIYGSSHYNVGGVAMRVGDCAINYLKQVDMLFVEVDQSKFTSAVPKLGIIKMQSVMPLMDQFVLDAIDVELFGLGDGGNKLLMQTDALGVLNLLLSRVPGSELMIGRVEAGLDFELLNIANIAKKILNIWRRLESSSRILLRQGRSIMRRQFPRLLKLLGMKMSPNHIWQKNWPQ